MRNQKAQQATREIGMRLRYLRKALELSMQQVAKKLGVSHQQICKYEKGIDRISAGSLTILFEEYRISASDFFNIDIKDGTRIYTKDNSEILDLYEALPTMRHKRIAIEMIESITY
ncbi:hypothetical protein LCGC14_1833840 [marine sediment metagenome]|uniref:HTH cro/C1-type domain-containing protein n=1 Tax=marine sediment metagenome TaxID=412755 RepID=A0A0F9GFF4_9ZZZZ